MKTLPLFVMTLAGMVAAACSFPETSTAPPTHTPIWRDTGTPPASVVTLQPEVRYYRDETGATWDDQGRKVSAGS